MKRRHALAPLACLAVALSTVVACGVQPTAPIFAGVAPGRLSSAGPYVYFIVAGVLRPLPVSTLAQPDDPGGTVSASAVPSDAVPSSGATPDLLVIALERLARGPTTKERSSGIRTDLPAGMGIGIQSRSDTSVVLTVTSPIDRFGEKGMTQIVCTVTRATARLASGEKQIPPQWQYPHQITIVTPDGKQHAGQACGKYLDAPPFTP